MKKILSMMIVGILCLSMFVVVAPRATSSTTETPLQVAEKAATWTISQAISENGGYKWAGYTQAPYYASSMQYGSAGFGVLYLELYEKTGNLTYLDYAEGAAQWIISQAVPDSDGYKWPHFDDDNPSPGWWLSPVVSGIGEFLLEMYRTTGSSLYLDYAKGAAQWLMSMAYWGEPGCFIPYNPPDPYGTQAAHGIDPAREAYTVTFLLHLYEETGDTSYMPYVEGTAEWLISGPDQIQTPNGYEWRFNRPYYEEYPIDGEGRIALFFYEIYNAVGNTTYLAYAQGTMNWLLDQATVNGDTAKWYDPASERGVYRSLPFSGSYLGGVAGFWGVPEPNELLTSVYEVTKNATYLDYARKLANWIISPTIAVPEGGGYKFPDCEGGSFYSAAQNARIYNFLSWLYGVTGETLYRDYADGALQWIIFDATEANGGYKWKTVTYFPYYAAWFEPGAAGIGYYLASASVTMIPSAVDINPNALNLRSKGLWITVHIEFPEGYSVKDINISSILLNGTVSAAPKPFAIGDFDSDGIRDLMVKFNRADVAEYILNSVNTTEAFNDVTLTVTGYLNDRTQFQGSSTVTVISPRALVLYWRAICLEKLGIAAE